MSIFEDWKTSNWELHAINWKNSREKKQNLTIFSKTEVFLLDFPAFLGNLCLFECKNSVLRITCLRVNPHLVLSSLFQIFKIPAFPEFSLQQRCIWACEIGFGGGRERESWEQCTCQNCWSWKWRDVSPEVVKYAAFEP